MAILREGNKRTKGSERFRSEDAREIEALPKNTMTFTDIRRIFIMMNKNTAILDNTMMDAYLTVTEGVSDNCGIGLAFASLLESAKKNFVNQSNRRSVNASFAG